MRILLCGYHEAGYRLLRMLIAQRHELLVATHTAPSELPDVAALARSCQIETIVDDARALLNAARRFQPDVLFCAYYREIIPDDILATARRGAYNFHPSLLPRHRGCFSAPWAIIEGDTETGVTCHAMTSRIDAGDIVDQTVVPIDASDTGMSLYYKLVDATVALFPRVLDAVLNNRVRLRPQQGSSSFHPRRIPYGGLIDPSWSPERTERFIRAMFYPPYPPAAVLVDGIRCPVRSIEAYQALVGARSFAGNGSMTDVARNRRRRAASPSGIEPAAPCTEGALECAS